MLSSLFKVIQIVQYIDLIITITLISLKKALDMAIWHNYIIQYNYFVVNSVNRKKNITK